MKRLFRIYGLRVIGASKFFYIGVTINMKDRIGCHIWEALNSKGDLEKGKIIAGCDCKIEMVELDSILTDVRTEANDLENEWIDFLRGEGHPLTNKQKQPRYPNHKITLLPKKKTA